jgi:hypothetical protein
MRPALAAEQAKMRTVTSALDILPHELVHYDSLNETSLNCKRKVESPNVRADPSLLRSGNLMNTKGETYDCKKK